MARVGRVEPMGAAYGRRSQSTDSGVYAVVRPRGEAVEILPQSGRAILPSAVTTETVNVSTVLLAVHHDLGHLARSSRIDLRVRIETDAVARAEERMLGKVMHHLVDNALRFAPPNTTVDIGCRLAEGAVELTVSDQGPGLDKSQCDRLFEAYLMPGEADNDGFEESLAHCRKVVRAVGGDVYAESVQGGGGRFVVRLDLA